MCLYRPFPRTRRKATYMRIKDWITKPVEAGMRESNEILGGLESEDGGRKAPKSDIGLSGARTVADDTVRRTDLTPRPEKSPFQALKRLFSKRIR